jgi:hypothetical protein
MTKDGVRLRTVDGGVTATVLSVDYKSVAPDASIVPDGYRRVPADDDLVFRPIPRPPMD